MKINLSDKPKSNIPTLKAGTYQAVISAIWDIGVQKTSFEGVESTKHQLIYRFEVNKAIKVEGDFNGKRYTINARINVPGFFGEKATVVKIQSAIDGEQATADKFNDFDTDSQIGGNVLISTGITSGGNAKITGYSSLMDGMTTMTPELDPEMQEWVKKIASEAVGNETSEFSAPPAPEDTLPF